MCATPQEASSDPRRGRLHAGGMARDLRMVENRATAASSAPGRPRHQEAPMPHATGLPRAASRICAYFGGLYVPAAANSALVTGQPAHGTIHPHPAVIGPAQDIVHGRDLWRVSSGNPEVLSSPPRPRCLRIEVNTRATVSAHLGSGAEDFAGRHAVGGLRLSIHDAGATPAVGQPRLDQAFETCRGGAA